VEDLLKETITLCEKRRRLRKAMMTSERRVYIMINILSERKQNEQNKISKLEYDFQKKNSNSMTVRELRKPQPQCDDCQK